MTTKDVARIFGVSPQRVQQMCKRGQLKAVKLGRDWWIEPAALATAERRKGGRPPKGAK